ETAAQGGGEAGGAAHSNETDEIRPVGFEARRGADIDEIGRSEGITACNMIGLTEQRVGGPAIVVAAGIAHAEIDAGATFNAVVAGEFVALEQGGGVEDEALRIFVRDRQAADILFIRPHEKLPNRLDDV